MERHLDQEINALKERLLMMASHAEAAVNQSVQALTTRDLDLALRVKERDSVIDQFEIEIDELAIHLLSKNSCVVFDCFNRRSLVVKRW